MTMTISSSGAGFWTASEALENMGEKALREIHATFCPQADVVGLSSAETCDGDALFQTVFVM